MTEDYEVEEMEGEELKEFTRKYEDDILGGLIAAASYKTSEDDTAEIQVVRNGAIVLSFRIRPLSEEEFMKCRRDNTEYKKNRQTGVKVADRVNAARYRAQLIFQATVDEDRDKIWCNREAWKKLAVVNGIDLIEVVLKAGEKDAIIDKLEEISGYQNDMETTVKN